MSEYEGSSHESGEINRPTLMDDAFFTSTFKNNFALAYEVLQPIFEEILQVELGTITSVDTQVSTTNLEENGVTFDGVVKTEDGKFINVEVQRGEDFSKDRSGYYEAAYLVDKLSREEFEKAPFYQIVFTDVDRTGKADMIEVVERVSNRLSTNEESSDSVWIYLSSAQLRDDPRYKEVIRVLRDFSETDSEKIQGPAAKKAHLDFKKEDQR